MKILMAFTVAVCGVMFVEAGKTEWKQTVCDEVQPEGNYLCTVTLGDREKATVNWVKAEGRRQMLPKIETKPGEIVKKTFVVNTRNAKLTTGGEIRKGGNERDHERWDDRLTVLVMSDAGEPKIEVAPAPADTVTVFLAGDSTVCCYNAEPYCTWGQMLPEFFDEKIAIANHAQSGRALSSFKSDLRQQKVMELMKPGDWLFIQFGHNDQKEKCEFDERMKRYNERLEKLIDEFTAKGGRVALVSPMERRRFDREHKPFKTLQEYEDAMRAMAEKKQIPFLNLHELSFRLYTALGEEKSKALFAFRRGELDNTHHAVYGGYELARAMVELIKANIPELAAHLREGIPSWSPEKPDEDPKIPRSGKVAKAKPDEK